MAVTGGVKFFEPNFADSRGGSYVIATISGQSSADFIIDRNKYTVWRSVGSNDTITEQLTVYFPGIGFSFSRLFIIGHNFKDFRIRRWQPGPGYIDFPATIGINSQTAAGINETNYELNSAYYEFQQISTDKILIECQTTQIANQEKFLNLFIITDEIGTFQGFPLISEVSQDRKNRKSIMLNGRSRIDKSLEVMRFLINFQNYFTLESYRPDLDLIYKLFDRDDNFLTWLCGGRADDPWFKYSLRGFRVEDLIETQIVNQLKGTYKNNYYNGVIKLKMILEEAA